MRSTKLLLFSALICTLVSGAFAAAATVSGTVTNKTTNTPSAGDKVELVDVQAGMSVVTTATTDSKGRYKIDQPGSGPYLIRVTHQGGQYFIASPGEGTPADIPVYDVAAHIDGISIEADVMEIETDNGQLRVTERYFVHNTGQPPHTQYNPAHGFEIVLPDDAVVDGASARRPTGLPTSTTVKPAGAKGHFQFDFPIQPDEGDKDTLFQITYHMAYSGKAIFHPQVMLPADNVAVLLPLSIKFEGSGFNPIKQDPGIQTFLAKSVTPGGGLEFAITGEGQMPREQQAAQGQQSSADAGPQATPTGPGGGIGEPIGTPDPLTKYKWWILSAIGLMLAATAGFLLRKPSSATTAHHPEPAAYPSAPQRTGSAGRAAPAAPAPPATGGANLLGALKDELFALETEKVSGAISKADYLEQKNALEAVLKRALKK